MSLMSLYFEEISYPIFQKNLKTGTLAQVPEINSILKFLNIPNPKKLEPSEI